MNSLAAVTVIEEGTSRQEHAGEPLLADAQRRKLHMEIARPARRGAVRSTSFCKVPRR